MSSADYDREFGTRDLGEMKRRRRRNFFRGHVRNTAPWELAKILEGSKDPQDGLRGLMHGGDVLWWQCHLGTHGDVLVWLGVPGGLAHRDNDVEFHRCTDEDEVPNGTYYLTARNDGKLQELRAHRSIAPHVRPGPTAGEFELDTEEPFVDRG